MEVQKRGNHGTLSAQLHNKKSIPLVVSILDIMFSVPVAEPLAPSVLIRPAQLPHMQGSQPGTVSLKETESKQLINMWVRKSIENKQEHPVPYSKKKNLLHVLSQQTEQMLYRWCDFWGIKRSDAFRVNYCVSKFYTEHFAWQPFILFCLSGEHK